MAQDTPSQKGETALIAFTLLMPASAGISLIGMLDGKAAIVCLVAAAVGAMGLAASLAHLARPLRAPFSIIHWRESWLSREILSAGAYWFVVIAWCLAVLMAQPGTARFLSICAVVFGLVMLFVIAQSYRLHTRPAWDGIENVLELLAVMTGAGTAIGILSLSPDPSQIMLWGGVIWIGLGAGLDFLAFRNRSLRLSQMPPQANVVATITNYHRLSLPINISSGLNGTAFILSIAAAASQQISLGLWIIILIAELISHILARFVFYSLPVQTRFVPRLRPPWPHID